MPNFYFNADSLSFVALKLNIFIASHFFLFIDYSFTHFACSLCVNGIASMQCMFLSKSIYYLFFLKIFLFLRVGFCRKKNCEKHAVSIVVLSFANFLMIFRLKLGDLLHWHLYILDEFGYANFYFCEYLYICKILMNIARVYFSEKTTLVDHDQLWQINLKYALEVQALILSVRSSFLEKILVKSKLCIDLEWSKWYFLKNSTGEFYFSYLLNDVGFV